MIYLPIFAREKNRKEMELKMRPVIKKKSKEI